MPIVFDAGAVIFRGGTIGFDVRCCCAPYFVHVCCGGTGGGLPKYIYCDFATTATGAGTSCPDCTYVGTGSWWTTPVNASVTYELVYVGSDSLGSQWELTGALANPIQPAGGGDDRTHWYIRFLVQFTDDCLHTIEAGYCKTQTPPITGRKTRIDEGSELPATGWGVEPSGICADQLDGSGYSTWFTTSGSYGVILPDGGAAGPTLTSGY